MNRRATSWWAGARPLSLVVLFLAGLALSVAWGCGEGREGAGERQASQREAAPVAQPAPEPVPPAESEAAERGEHGTERAGEPTGERGPDSGSEHGEEAGESGTRYGVSETARETRSGVELVLQFDAAAGAFVGTVANSGTEPVSRVRVEVHLVGAVELGPTPTITLAPGETSPVRLDAGGHAFETWMAHVEIGEGEHGGERHRGFLTRTARRRGGTSFRSASDSGAGLNPAFPAYRSLTS